MFGATPSQVVRTIPVLIAICLLALPAHAKYSGGAGEPNDPYQIATAADLIALGETPNDYDKHFILTADIDLDPNLPGRKVFDRAVIAPDTDQTKDWHQGTSFTGVLDGNRHTISHLTVIGGSGLGLIGRLGLLNTPAGEVRNLGVVDFDITASGYEVGGLVGRNVGTLSQCYSVGTVNGGMVTGGLAGYTWGSVTQCYSAGTVYGENCTGGLVGQNLGLLVQCYSTAAAYGNSAYGNNHVGGLVGANIFGTITQCYAAGAVSSNDGIGGPVGGLVGSEEPGPWYVPLIVTVTQSFWDIQTSGQTTSAGGTGKTTAEMQTASTFLDAGWDFVGETENGTDDVWKIAEGLGYPRLAWEKYSGGTGEPNDPYQIATAADLIALGETPEDYDKHFILIADINLDPNLPGGRVFDRAVIAPVTDETKFGLQGAQFTGVFDGSGHTISNLTIKGKGHLGLFGTLGWFAPPVGEVKNLRLVDVNIAGSGSFVGGLVAYIYPGIVMHCSSSGTVRGDQYVGGLVGANDGNITACSSAGTVRGDQCVGGLVGYSRQGLVSQCYSASAVSGHSSVGGLVGLLRGVISHCYSCGLVSGADGAGGIVGTYAGGHVERSFWDIQTSGQTWSAGGAGKITAEMQTAATYLDAGWDFVGETENGIDDIWWILEGQDYPRLWWELTDEETVNP